MKYLVQDAVK